MLGPSRLRRFARPPAPWTPPVPAPAPASTRRLRPQPEVHRSRAASHRAHRRRRPAPATSRRGPPSLNGSDPAPGALGRDDLTESALTVHLLIHSRMLPTPPTLPGTAGPRSCRRGPGPACGHRDDRTTLHLLRLVGGGAGIADRKRESCTALARPQEGRDLHNPLVMLSVVTPNPER